MTGRGSRLPATVAIKCAEDAKLWGVHLSAAQREAMDALVERLVQLAGPSMPDDLDAGTLFERLVARDPEAQCLAAGLHFAQAAKRRGFFLQYLADALRREGARVRPGQG